MTIKSKTDSRSTRYPLCADQIAQIDCRRTDCRFHGGAGNCLNVSPAITIQNDKRAKCWSYDPKEG